MADVPSAGREDGYRYYHGRRVAQLACGIARQENLCVKVDCLVVAAASLFHDLGKCTENHESDHGKAGSQAVEQVISEVVDQRQLRRVKQAIYWHNKRHNSPSGLCCEGKLLQDADLLDHFGAQEVWLTLYSAADKGMSVHGAVKMWQSERMRSWTEYARQNLNFATGRRALQKRLQFGRRFFRQLRREEKGQLQ